MQNISKILFALAFACGAVAFGNANDSYPPYFCDDCRPFTSKKGVMTLNTLQRVDCKEIQYGFYGYYNLGCFSGEVELTGAITSRYTIDSPEDYASSFVVFFHPDENVGLPFLPYSRCDSALEYKGAVFDEKAQKWDCSKVELEFWDNRAYGIKIKAISGEKGFLLKEIVNKHLGGNGIRAKVRLTDYEFIGEGEAGSEAYATLVEFSPLSKIYKWHTNDEYVSLKYGSKDSFINLRYNPKGNIIAQIKRKDMRCGAERAKIVWAKYPFTELVEDEVMPDSLPQNEWLEVFYLPPNAKKPQEAIYGYIHSSQLKVSCE
ncbi:hypothetical protein [Helicobacter sp. T3_23-1056]